MRYSLTKLTAVIIGRGSSVGDSGSHCIASNSFLRGKGAAEIEGRVAREGAACVRDEMLANLFYSLIWSEKKVCFWLWWLEVRRCKSEQARRPQVFLQPPGRITK